MLKHLDLNRFWVFSAVYRSGSVTGAARALAVTPSAVSQALSGLEAQIGTRLFQRLPRKLMPTRQADSLFVLLEQFSGGLEANLRDWRRAAAEPKGTLRIGALLEFGSRQVVEAAARLTKFEGTAF